MQKFLVTGGAGFIGSNIAWHLVSEKKAGVTVLDNFSSGNFKNLLDFRGNIVAADIREDSWFDKVGHIDVVYHEAAITDTTVHDQKLMMNVNVDGFRNVLKFAQEHGVKRVIYASSAGVYGNGPSPMREDQTLLPENIYGFSKAIMDNVARDFAREHSDMTVVGLRYFNVYGPREYYKGHAASMMFQLYNQMKAGNRPHIFKYGEQQRDFVYVKDIIAGNMKALEAKKSCVCNLGTGKAGNFNEIVAALNKGMGLNFAAEYIDNPYPFFQKLTQADLTNSRACLGYEPEWSLADGVADYVATLKKDWK